MLCETILSYINMFPNRDNQVVCNNHKLGRDGGGVALYIRDEFNFSVRNDLTISYDYEVIAFSLR